LNNAGPMGCEELVELITDYLEGSLAVADQDRLHSHLAECPACVEYLEQMRLTIRALGKLSADSIPPPILAKLLRIFHDWKASA